MEKREKFLPIGSVVLLNGGKKKIMITGFCSISSDDKTRVYDYSGCIYPEGYLSSNQICLFDHEQIEDIYFIGYENEEETEFKKQLNEVFEDFKERAKNFDEELEEEDLEEDIEEDNITENIEDLEHL